MNARAVPMHHVELSCELTPGRWRAARMGVHLSCGPLEAMLCVGEHIRVTTDAGSVVVVYWYDGDMTCPMVQL